MVALQLPTEAPEAAAAAAQTHSLIEIYPKQNLMSAYRTLIPDGWRQATRIGGVRFEPCRPVPLGFFTADNTGNTVITITQADLPVEFRLEDWVRAQCAFEGWSVFEVRWVDYPSGRRLDVGSSRWLGKEQHVRRTTAFVDHGRILRHDAFVRVADWLRYKDALWVSAASFELVRATGNDRFERWSEHTQGFLTVRMPNTWEIEGKKSPSSISAIDARLFVRGRLFGYVRVKAEMKEKAPSLEQELLISDRELRQGDMTPARRKTEVTNTLGETVPEGWLGKFESVAAVPGNALVQVRYGYKFTDNTLFSVLAVSEQVEKDRLGFLRTNRAFEIASLTAESCKENSHG